MASVVREEAPEVMKIDPTVPLDIDFWATVLDALPLQIAHATSLVGCSVHRVQVYLETQRLLVGSAVH